MCPRRSSQSQRRRPSCRELGQLHPGRRDVSRTIRSGLDTFGSDRPLTVSESTDNLWCARVHHWSRAADVVFFFFEREEGVNWCVFSPLPRSPGSALPHRNILISSVHQWEHSFATASDTFLDPGPLKHPSREVLNGINFCFSCQDIWDKIESVRQPVGQRAVVGHTHINTLPHSHRL